MIKNKLSIRLQELREEKNLLQKDIAKDLNISTSAYGYYEQGKREPDFETLINISNFFNVSTDYLLGQSEYKNYEDWLQSLSLVEPQLLEDEKLLLELYRKLTPIIKAEIKGEMKGILRVSKQEQSSTKAI